MLDQNNISERTLYPGLPGLVRGSSVTMLRLGRGALGWGASGSIKGLLVVFPGLRGASGRVARGSCPPRAPTDPDLWSEKLIWSHLLDPSRKCL